MTPTERVEIRRAAIEEAEKNQPDIWADEYFPYWDAFYSQFEEEVIARRLKLKDPASWDFDDYKRLCELAEIEPGSEISLETYREAANILDVTL